MAPAQGVAVSGKGTHVRPAYRNRSRDRATPRPAQRVSPACSRSKSARRSIGRPTTFDQLPEHVIDATIAAEDRTFWTNDGIDYSAIARAAAANLEAGAIVHVNARVEEMLGYGPGELIGRSTRAFHLSDQAFEEVAIEWLEAHEIPYRRE